VRARFSAIVVDVAEPSATVMTTCPGPFRPSAFRTSDGRCNRSDADTATATDFVPHLVDRRRITDEILAENSGRPSLHVRPVPACQNGWYELRSCEGLMVRDGRSPRITHLSWGRIEVEGGRGFKDAKLWPGGGRAWDWKETGLPPPRGPARRRRGTPRA
jgi:hypothetical protein